MNPFSYMQMLVYAMGSMMQAWNIAPAPQTN